MATLVCFYGMLRISEGLNLRAKDLIVPASTAQDQTFVIILPRSKRGFDERIPVTNVLLCQLLRTFLLYRRSQIESETDLLFAEKYWRYRQRFQLMVRMLRLPHGRWCSHSLRRGGATYYLEQGMALDSIRHLGRWASDRSCREYIRRGANALNRLLQSATANDQQRLDRLASLTQAALALAVELT